MACKSLKLQLFDIGRTKDPLLVVSHSILSVDCVKHMDKAETEPNT
jgi:hypothetical protein